MSTDQSVSQEKLEETRQEIRVLVGEIARLAREDLEPGEFCAEFLGRVVSAMAAIGGAVWMAEDGQRLALLRQVNLQQTRIQDQSEEEQGHHSRLLQKAFSDNEGLLVAPHGAGGQVDNPTDYLLVLAPLRTDLETVGVLEVFQRPDTAPEAQRGYLRFALQMCQLAGDFFRSRQLRTLSDRQALWSQLEDFIRAAHASLDVRRTAYTIANEGRRLIQCDRVTVAAARGRKCAIEAISGQDVFEKRSNTVRLLGKLAGMVAATREPVWYTGDTSGMAPQIEEVIQEYVDQAQSKAVGALPLVRPPPAGDDQQPDKDREPEQVVGVLIVERIEDSRVPENMRGRIDFVCRHSSSALANAWEHQSLLLMPLWKTLGKAKWVVRARTLPKTVLVLGCVIVLLAWLAIWPADFEMEASGTLEPLVRRNVFAGLDGRVEEVLVDHGHTVYHRAILGVKGTSVPGPLWAELQDDPEDPADELTLLVVAEGTCSFLRSGVRSGYTVRVRLPTSPAVEEEEEEPEEVDLLVRQVVDQRTLRLESGPAGPEGLLAQVEIWRISPLARLRSTELDLDITSVTGQQKTVREQMLATRRLLLEEADLTDEQKNRLSGQVAEFKQELRTLDRKLQLHRRRQQELLVAAPTGGLVVTWDVRNRLVRRPVKRGQALMQIADPNGPWQLELHMPEDQVGHILQRQHELEEGLRREVRRRLEAKNEEYGKNLEVSDEQIDRLLAEPSRERLRRLLGREPEDQLKVTYILATDPGTERTGRVVEIQQAAEVRSEEGSTVLIKVAPDDDFGATKDLQLLASRRPGAELQARVHCGRRPIGYVFFHDLIAFVHSRILFRL